MGELMNLWRTEIQITGKNKTLKTREIRVKRGIFQGDSFSPMWFCLAMNLLSTILNKKHHKMVLS